MLVRLMAWLFWVINYSICSTLKYKTSNEPTGQALFAGWHAHTFPSFFWARHRKVFILPTEIWRGEMIDFTARKFGVRTFRFLETQNPLQRAKVLGNFIQSIKDGYDAAITVDGPPPPLIYHKAKPGILYLSQKTGVPVAPVVFVMKRKITLFWRWDRFEIPLPWSEVDVKFGRPFVANEKTTIQALEEQLLRLGGEAQSAAAQP
jgi:hypothetical protein